MVRYILIILLFSCTKTDFHEPDNIIILDFDGHSTKDYQYRPSGLTPDQINKITIEVKKDFLPFNVEITTDEDFYSLAKEKKRQRVIITDSVEGVSRVFVLGILYKFGGLAVIGSMFKEPEYPALIFTYNLNYKTPDVAGTISHELGHTIGLHHQFNNEPAIMGKSFANPLATWVTGINSLGKHQNDIQFMKDKLNQ